MLWRDASLGSGCETDISFLGLKGPQCDLIWKKHFWVKQGRAGRKIKRRKSSMPCCLMWGTRLMLVQFWGRQSTQIQQDLNFEAAIVMQGAYVTMLKKCTQAHIA